jgi:undecaprenyl-diphosphatase
VATPRAWVFTNLCYMFVLIPLALVLVVLAIRFPQWRSRIGFAVVATLLAWRSTDLWQHFFARPRRLDWIVHHETAFSYPSGHAAISTACYLLLAILVARSALPGRAWIAAVLALLWLGILWSRLALGAHYLTDVAGGVLWGFAVTAFLAAVWPTNVFEGRPQPTLE